MSQSATHPPHRHESPTAIRRRQRARSFTAVTTAIAVVAAFSVGFWLMAIYNVADTQRQLQLTLARITDMARTQHALDTLALVGRDGLRAVAEKSDDGWRALDDALVPIDVPDRDAVGIAEIRRTERVYHVATTKELDLLRSGDFEGGAAAYRNEVTHAYVEFATQLENTSAGYDESASRTRKLAERATLVALLVFAGIALTLWHRLADSRQFATEMGIERQRSRNSEERFRSLVQNSSDVITVIDRDTTIEFVTPAVERVLGYLASNLLESRLSSLIHPDDRPRVLKILADASSRPGVAKPAVWQVRHADGRWLQMENVATNLLSDPTVGGIVLNTRDVTERMRLEQQLTHQAFHDSLTGLANRALFRDRVEHALARDNRKASGVAVLFLDLDNFKAVNDSLGHAEGDQLLIGVSARMLECVRTADTAARLGGDEFAVLIEDAPDIGMIVAIADRIVAALAAPFALHGKAVTVGASIGIAQAAPDQSADDLLRNADVAMYTAKGRCKGRYEIFQPEMHTAVLERLELEADLRNAIDRGEFRLMYQPIVELESGRVSGVEALARWHHPTRGIVSPMVFIPVAEEAGLIVALGRWALKTACAQGRAWQARHPSAATLSISVNVSGRQLQDASLVEDVSSALRDSGLAPQSLVLEITESVIMQNMDETLDRLRALKTLGVRLAIDDFGTGFSSLSYLQRFPVDTLKIDKSFIDGFGGGGKDSALVRTIIALSDTMRLRTVAEGVELAEQADELRALGCSLAQGYLFARPMNPADVDSYLARKAVDSHQSSVVSAAT